VNKALQAWIGKVSKVDPGLGALLKSVVVVLKEDDTLTFVWSGEAFLERAKKRKLEAHLGAYSDLTIIHTTMMRMTQADPMLDEAIRCGARLTGYETGHHDDQPEQFIQQGFDF
jgi:hypothetical protein